MERAPSKPLDDPAQIARKANLRLTPEGLITWDAETWLDGTKFLALASEAAKLSRQLHDQGKIAAVLCDVNRVDIGTGWRRIGFKALKTFDADVYAAYNAPMSKTFRSLASFFSYLMPGKVFRLFETKDRAEEYLRVYVQKHQPKRGAKP